VNGDAVRPLAFLLLGEQSLLVRCAERLLERGHRIAGVVAEDRRIREWAGRLGLPCNARYESLQSEPPDGGFDYLLSITNLRILPDWLLRMPRRGAINFHDGPLPCYAGLNAPVWALLNGEGEHGVSWHELTSGVDRGGILASLQVAVAADETAFRLNAKCYEAGYDSFSGMLAHIEAGALLPVDQDFGQRSYYGYAQRPARAACLDWMCSAEDLERLVRALDFGRYPNPVLLPKLDLGDTLLLVREAASVVAPPAQGPPGQVFRTMAGEIAVWCAEGAIALRRLTDLGGRKLEPGPALLKAGFAEGSVLPAPEASLEIEALVQRLAQHEAWWLRQFRDSEPTPAPYARRDARFSGGLIRRDVSMPKISPEEMAAVIALLLARLANRRDIGFALVSRELATLDPRLLRFVAPRSYLSLKFDAVDSFESWREQLSAQIERCDQRVGWLSDLPARQPDMAAALDSVASAPVLLLRVADFEEADLWLAAGSIEHVLVVVVANDGACRLCARETALEAGSLERLADQLAALAVRVADGGLAAKCPSSRLPTSASSHSGQRGPTALPSLCRGSTNSSRCRSSAIRPGAPVCSKTVPRAMEN
jgi:methionyl-tRNA formyltransferase